MSNFLQPTFLFVWPIDSFLRARVAQGTVAVAWVFRTANGTQINTYEWSRHGVFT